ncbi:terminase family protein [Salmonella enterica]|nr:hypothetical protein [Salmonella enterica]ECF5976294.1 hypothetical protein [Salmonella enterica subsp. arizonae]ECP3268764.1 hypothetical protein [Salmonella enterica subsp. enterica serovar [1],13,23:g,z51:-]EDO6343591.1 hypothetical protein [Salmonella enterica subsp. houtenae serovar 48:g,z51:-]EDU8174610.1 hypothetical protein [Salmonella enterica subsp. arizonae serovar 41:z4,z23:-]
MRFTTPEYRQNLLAAARALSNSTMEDIRNNLDVIEAAVAIKEQWKVEGFTPYEFQQKWFDSGLNHRLRYLSAANRIGKSFCAAVEFSYHATGLYPDWWRGYRVTNKLITTARVLWAIGVSADSTRTTIQLELLGVDDARQRHLFGTGSIPRERINMDSFVCDGQAVRSFRVYHESGEESTCRLYSAMQDEKVFMGQAIVYAWIDEQSPKEDELVSQAQTRTMTTDGVVAVTATPEHGETELYTRCRDDLSGEIHFQKASWDDAPHFTEEKIAEQLALTPYYQRDMRRHGEPVLGVGKIYPFSPDAITCAPFAIPDHWLVVAALDFGYTGTASSDPSVIVFVAYDRDTGKRYIFSEWYNHNSVAPRITEREIYPNAHMPDYMACKITGNKPKDWDAAAAHAPAELREFSGLGLPSIPVVAPNDGDGIQSGTQFTRSEIMRRLGAKMTPKVWKLHPSQIPMETNRTSKVGSIALLAQWFQDGELFIFRNCRETLRELGLYQWTKEGKRTIPSPKNDHFMDAIRYGSTRVEFDGIPMMQARRMVSPVEIQETPYQRTAQAYNKKMGRKL